nr:uncharacterized protein LOC122269017 [Parasteatoda tepidariorum]
MGDEICKHFAPSPATFTFPEENVLHQKIEKKSTNIAVGDWLAVIYDNLWYPGSVEEIQEDGFVLSFMHCSGDKFYWPSPEEKFTVPENEIMCIISDAPQPISRRHFIIQNKKKYDDILINILNS